MRRRTCIAGQAPRRWCRTAPLRFRFRDKSADAADSHAVEFALSCLDLVKSGGCHRTGADDIGAGDKHEGAR